MSRATLLRSLLLVTGALAWLVASAQQNPAEVSWSTDAPGAAVPAELNAGYTGFTTTNLGVAGYNMTLFRLLGDATAAELQAAIATIDQASASEEGDLVAAINAVLDLAEVYGELDVSAGASSRMGVVLEAGSYLIDGSSHTESGQSKHDFATFTVSGSASADAPVADQIVRMVDFAFALPVNIAGGEQTWQVMNAGQQVHHLVVFRLHEGKTIADVTAFLESDEGEPPGQEAAYVGVLSPGRSVYVDLSLEPGDYVAICFMPDHRGDSSGMPHAMLGMVQAFTIAN